MRNSIIFFKERKTANYNYTSFDCCESLGVSFNDRNQNNIMYVGIPKRELDEFFTQNNYDNIHRYLGIITDAFDIKYTIANPIEDEVEKFNLGGCGFITEDLIFIKIETERNKSNKYFNAAYNAMRYLWYSQYTNMAVIATNIFNLGIIDDSMDILAIAFSYQGATDRAILPVITVDLNGLLFFRPKEDVKKELQKNTPFNSVFYKYPIYFNPTVTIRGSFFEDAIAVIEAKDLFSKLSGILDINDIPRFMRSNIKLVYDDYLMMKHSYMQIKAYLDDAKLNMHKIQPLLLSHDMNTMNITATDNMGYNKKLTINVAHQTNVVSFTEDELGAKKKNIKKIILEEPW